jgi:hypothetical protein
MNLGMNQEHLGVLVKMRFQPAAVARDDNSSYEGGGYWDDQGSRPTQVKSSRDLHLNQ